MFESWCKLSYLQCTVPVKNFLLFPFGKAEMYKNVTEKYWSLAFIIIIIINGQTYFFENKLLYTEQGQ